VTKYGNVPPYRETVDYVAKVGQKYSQAKHAASKSVTPAKLAEKSQPSEEETRHVIGYVDQEGRLHLSTR
jgi:hypothetical protein